MSRSMATQPRKRRRLTPLYDRGAVPGLAGSALISSEPSLGAGEVDNLQHTPSETELPSDTLVALQLLQAQYPTSAKGAAIMLRSQVYSLVHDHTNADRSLDELRTAGTMRMFKLPSSVDDYAILFAEDYAACVTTAQEDQRVKGADGGRLKAFQWFLERVLARCTEVSITHSRLVELLATDTRREAAREAITDAHVSVLLNAGLLTRQVGSQEGYLFAVAGSGRVVSSIMKGRKELLGALGRKRYKEATMKDLQKWKLRDSVLDIRWHVRDLLGRGLVVQVETTSGALLRVVARK